jgi:hypothetical protein
VRIARVTENSLRLEQNGTNALDAATIGQLAGITNGFLSVTETNLQIIGTATQRVQKVYQQGRLYSRTVL